MAETAIQRLKRLAAEKAAPSPTQEAQEAQEEGVIQDAGLSQEESISGSGSLGDSSGTGVVCFDGHSASCGSSGIQDSEPGSQSLLDEGTSEPSPQSSPELSSSQGESGSNTGESGMGTLPAGTSDGTTGAGLVSTTVESADAGAGTSEKKNHPLLMEMAELEQALNDRVPGFANILREIHMKLKKDPATVTLLTDEEIGLIVSGLERHTNVTIVAPAAVKSAKKAAKVPVSALDL